MEKKNRYDKLVLEVEYDYNQRSQEQHPDGICLRWYNDCKEINLWTYWQGRNHYKAKIMLVGQDWGSPWTESASSTIEQIKLANDGLQYDYLYNSSSPTDKNLIELFRELDRDYDITHTCEDLFFTNFVLGYREHGFSGGYKKEWANQDMRYFVELTEILEPTIILCLGRSTFEAVLKALHVKLDVRIGNYNRFIESKRNPVTITLNGSRNVHIFALAHCGTLGTFNRNRGKGRLKDPLEIQKTDWKRIIPYL